MRVALLYHLTILDAQCVTEVSSEYSAGGISRVLETDSVSQGRCFVMGHFIMVLFGFPMQERVANMVKNTMQFYLLTNVDAGSNCMMSLGYEGEFEVPFEAKKYDSVMNNIYQTKKTPPPLC